MERLRNYAENRWKKWNEGKGQRTELNGRGFSHMMATCSGRTSNEDHLNVDTATERDKEAAMRFEVLIANMKITVSCGELPRSIVEL
jgi:hypothetical protein